MASAVFSLTERPPLRFSETDIIESIQVSAEFLGSTFTHKVNPLREAFFIKDKTYAQMDTLLREAYKKECKQDDNPIILTIPREWTLETISRASFNIAEKVQQWFMDHPIAVFGICFSDAPIVVHGVDPTICERIQNMIPEMRSNETIKKQFIDEYREGTPETKERNFFVQQTIQQLQTAILTQFAEKFGQAPQIDRFEIEIIYAEKGETQRRVSWTLLKQATETNEEQKFLAS